MTPSLMLAVMAAATSDPRSETRGKWIFTGAFPQDSGLLSTTHSAHSQFASAQRFYLWQGKREGLRLCTRRLETGLSQLGVKWGSRGSCENSDSWCCPSMTLDLRLKANTPQLTIWLPLCNYISGISRYELWSGQASEVSEQESTKWVDKSLRALTRPVHKSFSGFVLSLYYISYLHMISKTAKKVKTRNGEIEHYTMYDDFISENFNQKYAKKCKCKCNQVFMTLLMN